MRSILIFAMACVSSVQMFAADGVSGTWVSGAGSAAKIYVFKPQGDTFSLEPSADRVTIRRNAVIMRAQDLDGIAVEFKVV